jgi:hypothetical protein
MPRTTVALPGGGDVLSARSLPRGRVPGQDGGRDGGSLNGGGREGHIEEAEP